jgi:hypothetical protein
LALPPDNRSDPAHPFHDEWVAEQELLASDPEPRSDPRHPEHEQWLREFREQRERWRRERQEQEVIRLSDEERDLPADLLRTIAEGELEIHRGDLAIRREAADRLLLIFTITNITVLAFLIIVFVADVVLVVTGSEAATARIIDRGVVKTLIGATVVQVGTLMIAMARYLFPRTERQGLFFRPPANQQRQGFFARLFRR